MTKQFGGKLSNDLLTKYQQSPNWKEGKFMNLEETSMNMSLLSIPKLLYKQFFVRNNREPQQPIPIQAFNKEEFLAPSDKAKFIWYGHSAVLMRINNKTLLIDPMLGQDAAPIAPFKSKRFSENTLGLIDQFPEIDLLLLSHDHYDHLDLDSMQKLMPKVKQYYVALGCARHLIHWGVDASKINEFDWWDLANYEGIEISFTPSRHFSGRGIRDRFKSLWGGWVFKTDKESIYFSGDGGYGEHFKEVGNRLGPFDFGLMECGQYNENWHQIHMYPEEAIQAAADAGVKKVMAVHWAGFALAQHSWNEPIERFAESAINTRMALATPNPGELFSPDNFTGEYWWKKHQ